MAKRGTQPALYEMMRNRGTMPHVPVRTSQRDSVPMATSTDREVVDDEPLRSPVIDRLVALLKPGQTLKIPVGYLLVGCAGVLVLLVIAYILGVNAGKSIQTATYREKLGEGFEISLQRSNVSDPLSLDPLPHANGSGVLSGSPGARSSGTRTSGVDSNESQSVSAWGPIKPSVDPRQKGWNYFIVATNTEARCVQLAEYCRANGLEAYVVPHRSGAQVVVFPGFQGSRSAPEVKALEQRIHQVGDRYKAANRHETNMRDAYPALYGG